MIDVFNMFDNMIAIATYCGRIVVRAKFFISGLVLFALLQHIQAQQKREQFVSCKTKPLVFHCGMSVDPHLQSVGEYLHAMTNHFSLYSSSSYSCLQSCQRCPSTQRHGCQHSEIHIMQITIFIIHACT